jgi:hypothetical protein
MLLSLSIYAQGTLSKGKAQINAGLGFSGWGIPVYAGVDFGLGKYWTIGPEVSYRAYREFYNKDYEYLYSIVSFSFNGNYHFNKVFKLPKEWDIYAGGTAGFFAWSNNWKWIGEGNEPIGYDPRYPKRSGIGFGLQVGARYFISKNFGFNFEISGGTLTGGKLGITYKL